MYFLLKKMNETNFIKQTSKLIDVNSIIDKFATTNFVSFLFFLIFSQQNLTAKKFGFFINVLANSVTVSILNLSLCIDKCAF